MNRVVEVRENQDSDWVVSPALSELPIDIALRSSLREANDGLGWTKYRVVDRGEA